MFRQKTDRIECEVNFFLAVIFVLEQLEVVKPFRDAVVNGGTLIQRGCRVLENHLDISLNPLFVCFGKFSVDLLSFEYDLTV